MTANAMPLLLLSMNEGDLLTHGAPFPGLDMKATLDWSVIERVENPDGSLRLTVHIYFLEALVASRVLIIDTEGKHEWLSIGG